MLLLRNVFVLILINVASSQPEPMIIRLWAFSLMGYTVELGSISLKDCTTQCLNNVECVLMTLDHRGLCFHWKYSDVYYPFPVTPLPTDNSQGKLMGIKVIKSECPVDLGPNTDLSYVDARNGVNIPFKWVWNETDTRWILPRNPCSSSTWQVFRRSYRDFICIKRFDITGKTQEEAREYCQSMEYTMFGVSSMKELTSLTGQGSGDIWVDGETTCPSSCTSADYTFTDGLTTSFGDVSITTREGLARPFCLIVTDKYMWATQCDSTSPTGVACGYKLPF